VDLENGRWQAAAEANFSDKSSDASFVSAKFHSFDEDRNMMFYGDTSQRDMPIPLNALSGILKSKEVFHLYNVGESFGSGKYGIIKLVQKKNYDKIQFAMKSIALEPGYEDYTQREFDILCKLDHPFLMNPLEVYFSPVEQVLNLVVPFYQGGEL
jgi:serine/threonine protein kinase